MQYLRSFIYFKCNLFVNPIDCWLFKNISKDIKQKKHTSEITFGTTKETALLHLLRSVADFQSEYKSDL